MKSKRTPIGKIVSVSKGKIIDETIIYGGRSPLDEDLSDDEFKEKYNKTKEEYRKLDEKYRAKPGDEDINIGCLSSEEYNINRTYKQIFGENLLPQEDTSWEQLRYLFREGKKAIAGERGVITSMELKGLDSTDKNT